jgi:hypothetical protein
MKSSMPSEAVCSDASVSRRIAIQRIVAGTSLAVVPESFARAQDANEGAASHDATQGDFVRLMTKLSNWNRWGQEDQMGAANLITPAKRKQALDLVKEGISFSMARNAETQQAVDNPQPIIRKTTRVGKAPLYRGSAALATFFLFPIMAMRTHTWIPSATSFMTERCTMDFRKTK